MAVLRFDVLSQHNTTDRERILHALLVGLVSNATLYDHQYRQFGHVDGSRKPQIGDWVVGMCGAVGQLVRIEEKENSFATEYFIRIAGTSTVQSWHNETFNSFANIHEDDLYQGDEWKFYCMARAGIYKDSREYIQRFAGLKFEGDDVVISFRKRWNDTIKPVTIPNYRRFLKYKTARPLIKELTVAGWGQDGFIPRAAKTDNLTPDASPR